MNILVVNTQVPFVSGGAEYLADNLVEHLKKFGHRVDHVKFPFKWYPPEKILDQILAIRLFDLTESCGESIDIVIGLKFPAYLVKHPNKRLWICHQHRGAYDLWETENCDIPHDRAGIALRNSIKEADNKFITEAEKIFTISKNVSCRLKKFNNIDSQPLYPPLSDSEKYHSKEYGKYIFFPSRLNPSKRQHLAIESMKHVKSDVKLVLAGGVDSKDYDKKLSALIKKHNLSNKVELLGRVSEEEKIRLYASALGVLFIPYDEDYGYITLEAFYSRKTVITCADSGGSLEFVTNGDTGLVCEPKPESIAKAIEGLASNRKRAVELGENAYGFIKGLNITWSKVVEELTK